MKPFKDQSSVPALLTAAERAHLRVAKAEYDAGLNRRYLSVLVEMRARSLDRLVSDIKDRRAAYREAAE